MLTAAAGLPRIDLHDVQYSYAPAGRDAKIDWKTLSQRIDRQVADTLAHLIARGTLASVELPKHATDAAVQNDGVSGMPDNLGRG